MWKTSENLIEQVKDHLLHCDRRIEYLEKQNKALQDEHYKDLELQKMKEELDRMKKEYYRGFPISEKEAEAISNWKKDWFARKRGGNTYMGASGGGFTYKFYPTGIGTSGVIIAPDGEEFEFQELG